MPLLPFERARRNAVKHLDTYLGLRGRNGRLKPISEKSALFRAMTQWESFFPGRCLPIQELFWWLDLLDQSRTGDPKAFKTAMVLLELVEGPYTDPTLPVKEGDRWCHIDLKTRTITIAGVTTHFDHLPTLRILDELSKASDEKPVPSRNLRKITGCGHARQVGRFLDKLPAKIRKLIKSTGGAGGGRWLVPPWQA
jgi:hypothetical protein